MSGTSTYVADEMADALKAKGIKAFVVQMEKAELRMFDTRKVFIICSSSHGAGDIPDNGVAFFESLERERPDLGDVRYGTVGIGDMTYSASFCGGSAQFDRILAELGANRLVQRLEHDRQAGGLPEDDALEWLEGWLEAAAASATA